MLVFKLTSAGLNAALNAQNLGLKLELATIKLGSGQYNVVENDPRTAMVSPFLTALFAGGGVEPDSHTLRFNSSFKDNQSRPVYEIGIFTRDGVLFAITSTTGEPYFLTSKTLTTVVASGLKLGAFNSSTVQLVLDQNGAMALHIIGMHEAHTDPHPQYVKEGDFSDLSGLIENLFVRKTQIVNNLNSTSATDVLSAKMGNDLARSAAFRVFFGQTSGSIVNSDNTNTYIRLLNGDLVPMGGSTRVYGTGNVVVNTLNGELNVLGKVNDTLYSTAVDEALSARQGKNLSDAMGVLASNLTYRINQLEIDFTTYLTTTENRLNEKISLKFDKTGGNVNGDVHIIGNVYANNLNASLGAGLGDSPQRYYKYLVPLQRAVNTIYNNTTGKPILVMITLKVWDDSRDAYFTMDGIQYGGYSGHQSNGGGDWIYQIQFIVRAGSNYSLRADTGSLREWSELRD